MAKPSGLAARFEQFQASKTVLFWACAGAAIAVMVVGFGWGGWVTGGTADRMATQAASAARADLAAQICVNRFTNSPNAAANLVSLKATDSWKQHEIIEKGGWVTIPGTDQPVADASSLCADRLVAEAPSGASR